MPTGFSWLLYFYRSSDVCTLLPLQILYINTSCSFTLIFDNYVASIGPGIAITENRKNCQLDIDLEYPSGFQYSVFSTIYRGYVGLDANVTATQGAVYYFSGGITPRSSAHYVSKKLYLETAQTSTATTFHGPLSKDYEVVDDISLTSVVWSPCGEALPLNIDSSVLLTTDSTTATGQITDDSEDGKITFITGIQWQTC
jgi:hypothetical protein